MVQVGGVTRRVLTSSEGDLTQRSQALHCGLLVLHAVLSCSNCRWLFPAATTHVNRRLCNSQVMQRTVKWDSLASATLPKLRREHPSVPTRDVVSAWARS